MDWEYDEQTETWLAGTSKVGVGVMSEEDGFWANVVTPAGINAIGPFPDLETAKKEAEEELTRLVGDEICELL